MTHVTAIAAAMGLTSSSTPRIMESMPLMANNHLAPVSLTALKAKFSSIIPAVSAQAPISSTNAGMMICGPIAGLLSDRIGSRPICILGSVVVIAAFLMFVLMGANTGLYYIIIALALEGVGIGLIMPANFNLIMDMSVKGSEGVINSLVSTVRNVGAVMGIASFTLVFLSVITSLGVSVSGVAAHSLPPKAFIPGFHAIFLFGVVLGGVLLVLNLAMRGDQGVSKTH
jgi:MFS family permease